MEFVLRRTTIPRPREAPNGWVVFCATRPLEGGHKFWTGEFVCGTYYAAYYSVVGIGEEWKRKNLESDAKVVEFLTEDEAVNLAREYCLLQYGEAETATFSRKTLLDVFYDYLAWDTIQL